MADPEGGDAGVATVKNQKKKKKKKREIERKYIITYNIPQTINLDNYLREQNTRIFEQLT